MSDISSSTAPPPYIQTIYDETHRGISLPFDPQVLTLSPGTNLVAHLEHHSATTDGSVGICITTTGNITVISKELYDSIPEAHRPELHTSSADITVSFSGTSSANPLGHVFLPLLLDDLHTGTKVRVVLYALVMRNLILPMFIGNQPFIAGSQWGGGGVVWIFDFGGREVRMKGVLS